MRSKPIATPAQLGKLSRAAIKFLSMLTSEGSTSDPSKIMLSQSVYCQLRDEILNYLLRCKTYSKDIFFEELNKKDYSDFDIIALTVPFPGTLLGTLKTARWFKKNYPDKIIVLGGGYVITELRSLKEHKIFEFVDFICLDDGEMPLLKMHEYFHKQIAKKDLIRTFYIEDGKVLFSDNSFVESAFKIKSSFTVNVSPLPIVNFAVGLICTS